MRETVEYALQTGTVIHLIGGSDVEMEATVERVQAATDSELLRVDCTPDTSSEEMPNARVSDGMLVFYADFGKLPSDVQVTAAQCIKSHFEFGIPVVVRSSDSTRGDLTLRNGDLRGRVRAVELESSVQEER